LGIESEPCFQIFNSTVCSDCENLTLQLLQWKVTRLGADIGLECRGCGHRVLLTRRELARRVKTFLPKKERIPSD
jgi:hypothetical protein